MFSFVYLIIALAVGAETSTQLEWYNYARLSRNSSSLLNSDNRRFKLAEQIYTSDLRLEASIRTQSNWLIILRPQLKLIDEVRSYDNPEDEDSLLKGELRITEAFVQKDIHKNINVTVGMQNYQWGPAETLSPSNPFFHFKPEQRFFYFREVGRFLLRANSSIDDAHSLVVIAEPVSNRQRGWISEQRFYPKFTTKIERQFSNSLNYLGLTLGSGESGIIFTGLYGNSYLSEAVSVYFDGSYTFGTSRYMPRQMSGGYFDMEYERTNNPQQTAVLGLRLEGKKIDVRLEQIFNSAGLSRRQQKQATLSLLSPFQSELNRERLNRPGLELLGKGYTYLSIRVPDLFKPEVNLFIRYFLSHQDNSGSAYLGVEAPLSLSAAGFTEVGYNVGKAETELAALEKYFVIIGARWNL